MAPVKRPAGAMGGASKKAKTDPVKGKCLIVQEALEEATFMPESCRTMLASMVDHTLTTVKEERHPYQNSIVTKLGEALAGIKEKMEKAFADAKAEADGIHAMKTAREAAVGEAEKALTVLQEATAGCKTALEEAKTAKSAAQEASNSALAVQKESDKSLDKLEAKKADLEAAKGTDLVTLGAADSPDKAMKAALKTLVKLGKENGFDSGMLDALPMVLKKAPAERGNFCTVIITQLGAEIDKVVAVLTKEIEDGAPGKAERAAAVTAAVEVLTAATAKVQECADALSAAKTAEKAGDKALQAAKDSVATYIPDVKKVLDTFDETKAALPAFAEGPMAAYDELKELTPPPPPVEEPEPAAEEPAMEVEAPVAAEAAA